MSASVVCPAQTTEFLSTTGKKLLFPATVKKVTSYVKFLNHASLEIRSNEFSMVVDPWFGQRIFNDGWSLLWRDDSLNLDNLSPNAVWLSHEHPDHFHPPTLLQIPHSKRPSVCVYFQKTNDKRVIDWCQANGFYTQEVTNEEIVRVNESFEFSISKSGIEDSAMLFTLDGKRYLNLNDCMFPSQRAMALFAASCGTVDFVLYLCGYAEGGGTRTDGTFRKALYEQQVNRLRWAHQCFPAAKVIGFAAFKYFCHEENSFQNDQLSFNGIKGLIDTHPEVFRLVSPGEILLELDAASSLNACSFWNSRISEVSAQVMSAPATDISTLVDAATLITQELSRVGKGVLRLTTLLPKRFGLRDLEFYLTDHQLSLRLSLRTCKASVVSQGRDAVVVQSNALQHALAHTYGISTLLINGRFQSNSIGRRNLYRWSVIGLIRTSEQQLSLRFLAENFVRVLRSLRS